RVDVQVRAPLVECRTLEESARRNAGIVDQYVDRAQALEESGHLVFVRHVANLGLRGPSRLERLPVASHPDDVIAGRREASDDRSADALPAARDDDSASDRHATASSSARNARRSILPEGVFGSSATKRTSRGYLWGERWVRM